MRSIWLGGAIAPLAAPLAFFCGILILSITKDGLSAGVEHWAAALGLITVFTLPVSYLVTWILGMPLIYWLRSSSHLSKWNICLGAVGIGIIVPLIGGLISTYRHLYSGQMVSATLISAGLALCVALTFCWIARVPSSSV
ncbi:MAG: hypothetical protein ABIQ36_10750 [Rhodanobacter sp.]